MLSSGLCTVLVLSNYTRGLIGLFEFALLLATVTVVVAYAGAVLGSLLLVVSCGLAASRRALLTEPVQVLREVHRVVTPGGRVGVLIELYADNAGSLGWADALDVDVRVWSERRWRGNPP